MTVPATLKAQLDRDEGGHRLKPYLDCCGKPWRECVCTTKGRLTIGVGRNLDDKGISLAESEQLLDNDIRDFTAAVVVQIPWCYRLDPVRFDALVNIAFNMGIGNLVQKNPKALAALERGDYETAKQEFLDGNWKRQVGPRAFRLAEQLATGVRQ